MKMMAIETEEQYRIALERVSGLMDAEPDSVEGSELDLLARDIEAYEEIHYPIKSFFPLSKYQTVTIGKPGFNNMIIRRHHDKYEYRTYVDHYGGEKWSILPFEDAIVEAQILQYFISTEGGEA